MTQTIKPKKPLTYNPITDTDSYKFSHWTQYPEGTDYMMSYLEARGGEFDECTLFGLQYLLHEYVSTRVTEQHVAEAKSFAEAHGEPFNEEGWAHIVNTYNGFMPVTIKAIPEGTVVPVLNAVLTIECWDPKCFWVVSWLETMLSRLWYPSTIATMSRDSKKILNHYLQLSSDTPEADLPFKLHDFGARGVTCLEQSRLGGAAHLLSFMGSDTVEGIRLANHYYDCNMAAFSICASEHSTVSSHGRDGELDFYRDYVKKNLTDRQVPACLPKLAACVSDTYNIFAATCFWASPEMRQILKDSGGTLVIRPDSGEPIQTLTDVFNNLKVCLRDEITINNKGFKVLPSYLRVIQGDGIDRHSMKEILEQLVVVQGWSATNIAFGSGGGLLQKVNRDTQKWAFKCCAIRVNGEYREVFKDPITDQGKRSKSGRLDLVKVDGQYSTIKLLPEMTHKPPSALVTVFENGQILYHTTLAECRERMKL